MEPLLRQIGPEPKQKPIRTVNYSTVAPEFVLSLALITVLFAMIFKFLPEATIA